MWSSGSNPCSGCEKVVYFAEQVFSNKKYYHKTCFKCTDCNKKLTVGQQLSNKNDPYCRSCYTKNFCPDGFRGAGLMAVKLRNLHDLKEDEKKPINYDELRAKEGGKKEPKSPDNYFVLKSRETETVKKEFKPKYNFTSNGIVPSYSIPNASNKVNISISKPRPMFSHLENCRKCNKRVYFAEKLKALKHVYHKNCFKCEGCDKRMNAGTQYEHKNSPYCQTCFSAKFAPSGYRFGTTVYLKNLHEVERTPINSDELREKERQAGKYVPPRDLRNTPEEEARKLL